MKFLIPGITLIIAIGISPAAIAQKAKKKGYVVLNNGDTTYGWIDYFNWERNPNSISLRKDSLLQDITSYSKYEIQTVEISGLDLYIKAVVEKDARPVTIGSLLPPDDDSLIVDTALLRVLVKGSQFNLYELFDGKYHFFIQKPGGDIKELKYRVVSNDNNNTYSTQKLFINQLTSYLVNQSRTEGLVKKIYAANYTEKDLTRIVTEMNNLSGNVQYVASVESKKVGVSFFAGAGGGYSNLKFGGNNSTLGDMQYKGSFVPYVTVGVDISSPRNLHAFTLRAEVSYYSTDYSGEGTKDVPISTSDKYITSYALLQKNISPTVSLLYGFVRKESLQIYVGAGVAWNLASYSKNIYTETSDTWGNRSFKDYLIFPKSWISPLLKLGIKLNHRISAELDGRFISSMTDYSAWSLTPQTFTGQIRYHF
ncbi:MAG: hypothetical protein J0I84_10150 [Terrimonas sp.]|nr:hypothetical protein [Terrimonas sp.]OJY94002.1 MAG: hypothetical protein BGP13_01850 [Sphingobacteriales bacterium 40-81]